jgi:hypothetical protein
MYSCLVSMPHATEQPGVFSRCTCREQDVIAPLVQVNAAVDDAASLAEGVARMLAAARGKGGKSLGAAERKRAQMLLVNVQVRPREVLGMHPACSPHGASQCGASQ